MKRIKLIIMLVVISLTACLRDESLFIHPSTTVPQEIGDGHELASPEEVGMDGQKLKEIFETVTENEDLWSIRSMLVLKDGKLVAEHYYKDPKDLEQQHLVWSCTKQVMGLLVGKAIEQGYIDDLDDPISKYLPEETKDHKDKQSITVRDLLTMRSGIAFSNDGSKGQTDKLLRKIPDNCIEFVLSLPMQSEPGTSFHYNDGDPLLLSAIIQNQTGKHTDEWADEVLFQPLGFKNYTWRRYPDGRTFGGFGIETTARELAKIGLCVMDTGSYKGQRLVSENWINQATTTQVETDIDFNFGFQWWIEPVRNLKIMWGHGGQLVFIDQQGKLVLVTTAIPNTGGGYQITAPELLPVFDEIVKAIR